MAKMRQLFTHPRWSKLAERAKGGGHGGMDFVMNWRHLDCIRQGEKLANKGSKGLRERLFRLRHDNRLQQQVIQTESQVECRIAIPRAFGIKKHRPEGADEYVLGAHIAVHQRDAR